MINIILCEGGTDQRLLGAYLERSAGWTRTKMKSVPFAHYPNIWYVKEDDENKTLGILSVNGTNFTPALTDIMKSETLEHTIERIAVVTDHDDMTAETTRLMKIHDVICKGLGVWPFYDDIVPSQWLDVTFFDGFASRCVIKFCYLLVPMSETGALETFMLEAISENPEMCNVVERAMYFIDGVKATSHCYLKRRREVIKSRLGACMAVFNPDRILNTTNWLIKSVEWEKFEAAHKQFSALREI